MLCPTLLTTTAASHHPTGSADGREMAGSSEFNLFAPGAAWGGQQTIWDAYRDLLLSEKGAYQKPVRLKPPERYAQLQQPPPHAAPAGAAPAGGHSHPPHARNPSMRRMPAWPAPTFDSTFFASQSLSWQRPPPVPPPSTKIRLEGDGEVQRSMQPPRPCHELDKCPSPAPGFVNNLEPASSRLAQAISLGDPRAVGQVRGVTAMVKILCVLYDDPVGGFPLEYARDSIPETPVYPGGQKAPSPAAVDFKPGDLLGCVSGELGLREFLEGKGHEFLVTASKDGLEQELSDAEIVISQPFWPAYMTADRIAKAPKLRLCVTAGVGSDHVDLEAACQRGITVAEVSYSNSISVAEHAVMMILSLVRNYLPSHEMAKSGGWNIADCSSRSYDVEGMHVGTVGAGRIGLAVLKRLRPFDTHLHYTDQHRLPEAVEKELNLCYHDCVESMVRVCDVVTINCPLHPATEHLFNQDLIYKMKRGSYLINTARGKICDRDAVADALKDRHLAGYAGDVWFPQPAPANHPWRSMPHHGMTPHVSGTTLSAQARYAAGVREILECFLAGQPIRKEYLIVQDGQLAGAGVHSYTQGNTTKGHEEAEDFQRRKRLRGGGWGGD
ncbi:unnamed protein product [Polarella glacialis]|uniref:Formate dehydrogenase n=1 Tax=Polarella glacialis TaxID=89957 RepID=A0A813JZS8_POLGL|nr:unnamed protein product [Polarella glacialis]